MGVLDFLFEGRPPPSTTTYGQTVEGMPKWMSDYTQGLISRANAIAAEPYQSYGGPRIAEFTPEQQQAFGAVPGIAQQGMQDIRGVQGMPGGLSTADPYLQQASQTFPGAVDQYMSPYMENVTDRAAQLTGRALNEQLLPGLEGKFGAAGHDVRSSAYRRAADRGVRDLSEGLQSQNLAALHQGYGQAGQLFGQDMSRMGALGQTAGNLAGQDIGQQGALAQQAQQMGLQGAAATEAVGAQQQGQTQRSLDLAHQDFQQQRDYPRENIDWMSSVVRGLPYDRSVQSQSVGPASSYQPSGLSQLGSLASTAVGAWDTWQNRARGGRIRRRYNLGGALRHAYA